jgi:hypothetical protein
LDERALKEHTVLGYVSVARLFLEGVMDADGSALLQLTAAEVSSFLARECPRRSVAGARGLVAGLRPFLRYLHLAGLIGLLFWLVLLLVVVGMAISFARAYTVPRTNPQSHSA